MNEVDSHLEGESLLKILTHITVCIIYYIVLKYYWYAFDIVKLQQSSDLR